MEQSLIRELTGWERRDWVILPRPVLRLSSRSPATRSAVSYLQAALKVYREVVARNPDNPKARVNLAHTLRESCELEEARVHYETVLRQVPDLTEAHQGLAFVLMYQREEQAAWEHQKKGANKHPSTFLPSREEKDLARILSWFQCNGQTQPSNESAKWVSRRRPCR